MLLRGEPKSKQCQPCAAKKANTTHGMASSQIYQIWFNVLRRCNDPRRSEFYLYGGRGIRVCKRWEKFENFLADMGERPEGMSLDRKDNDGDYKPSNCRWATAEEQARNKSTNRLLTYEGRTMPLAAWADDVGIRASVIAARIDGCGWSVGDALTTPVLAPGKRKKNNVELTYEGRTMILSDWAREVGIPKVTLWYRIFVSKWPVERALVP